MERYFTDLYRLILFDDEYLLPVGSRGYMPRVTVHILTTQHFIHLSIYPSTVSNLTLVSCANILKTLIFFFTLGPAHTSFIGTPHLFICLSSL